MSLVLSHADLRHILRAMPKDCRALMREYGNDEAAPRRIFLAGGAIRSIIAGEPVSDWDFLGESKAAVASFVRDVRATRSGYPSRLHESKNAATLLTLGHTPVQGITRWCYADALNLLAEFDFTIAKAVVWFQRGIGWRSACHDTFYADLAARRLRYTAPARSEDAGGSLLRAVKFLRRGYAIAPEDLAAVIARASRDYRPDGGIGFDRFLVSVLREVDPLTRFDGLDMDDGEVDPLAALPDAKVEGPGRESA